MAVKIFCNSCQKYIRDARRDELSELKGTEICEACASFAEDSKTQINKARQRAVQKVNQKADKAIADIEDIMRRVIEGGQDGDN